MKKSSCGTFLSRASYFLSFFGFLMIVTIKIQFSTGCSTIIVVQRERYLEHQLTTYCNITVGKKWKNPSLWSNVTFWWVTTDIYGWPLSMCLSNYLFKKYKYNCTFFKFFPTLCKTFCKCKAGILQAENNLSHIILF